MIAAETFQKNLLAVTISQLRYIALAIQFMHRKQETDRWPGSILFGRRTPDAEEHLARSGVTIREFQEVLESVRRRDIEDSNSSDYYTAEGFTAAGRHLRIVFDMLDDITVFPVTAYEPTEE